MSFLSLCIQYYNLNGKLPYITYEYTVPLKPYDIAAAEGITTDPALSQLNYNNTFNNYDKVNARAHQVQLTNHSRGSPTSVHHYNTQPGGDDQLDAVQLQTEEEEEEEEEVLWEIQTPSPPPPAAILVYRPADVTSHVFSHNDVEEQGPPAPPGYRESETGLTSSL